MQPPRSGCGFLWCKRCQQHRDFWVGAGGALLPQIFLISRNQLAHCSTSCSPLLRSEVLEPFLAKPVTVSL